MNESMPESVTEHLVQIDLDAALVLFQEAVLKVAALQDDPEQLTKYLEDMSFEEVSNLAVACQLILSNLNAVGFLVAVTLKSHGAWLAGMVDPLTIPQGN